MKKRPLILLFAAVLFLFSFSGCSGSGAGLTSLFQREQCVFSSKLSREIPESPFIKYLPPPEPELPIYFIPDLPLEDVLVYFNEVCLDSEYSYSGDPSLVQKWMNPIYYSIQGPATEEDLQVLAEFTQLLNGIYGFPGIYETDDPSMVNLSIHFCDAEGLVQIAGDQFSSLTYGAATYWYTNNIVTNGMICYRHDIDQITRNSILLEEIYNILGAIQDTVLRTDSVIYQYSDDALELSPEDLLILQLLYHPDIQCGMDADACAAVIETLYHP